MRPCPLPCFRNSRNGCGGRSVSVGLFFSGQAEGVVEGTSGGPSPGTEPGCCGHGVKPG